MAKKFKIKGKVYTLVEEMDRGEPTIIKYRAKVVDSKGVEFTLIHSTTGYHLYDSKEYRVVETLSIQEWEA